MMIRRFLRRPIHQKQGQMSVNSDLLFGIFEKLTTRLLGPQTSTTKPPVLGIGPTIASSAFVIPQQQQPSISLIASACSVILSSPSPLTRTDTKSFSTSSPTEGSQLPHLHSPCRDASQGFSASSITWSRSVCVDGRLLSRGVIRTVELAKLGVLLVDCNMGAPQDIVDDNRDPAPVV